MTNIRIAPSILSADFARLSDAIRLLEEAGADLVHLDVMDGHFVPNITIGPPVVQAIRKITKLTLDCHLMIEQPQRYIEAFLSAGANMISIHAEAETHLERAFSMIRSGGALAGLAINPATSAATIEDALQYCDFVLIMSVNPGFGGQKFLRGVLPKIRRIREMIQERRLPVKIEVDGGIDSSTAASVVDAGAEILVAGSAIFNATNPVEALRSLRTAASSALV